MYGQLGSEEFQGQNILIDETLESWDLLASHIPNLMPQHVGLDSEVTAENMRLLSEGDLLRLRRKVVHTWFEIKLSGTSWVRIAQDRDDEIVQRRLESDRNQYAYPAHVPYGFYGDDDIAARSG